MPAGTVKWFDPQKGFGFISPDQGGSDVFVHASMLPEGITTLPDGQRVEYEVEMTPRGVKVVQLTLR